MSFFVKHSSNVHCSNAVCNVSLYAIIHCHLRWNSKSSTDSSSDGRPNNTSNTSSDLYFLRGNFSAIFLHESNNELIENQ
jgi:hypothetical protein